MCPGHLLLSVHAIRDTTLHFEVLKSQLVFDSVQNNSTSLRIANKVFNSYPPSYPSKLLHYFMWLEPHQKISSPCILLFVCRTDGGSGGAAPSRLITYWLLALALIGVSLNAISSIKSPCLHRKNYCFIYYITLGFKTNVLLWKMSKI